MVAAAIANPGNGLLRSYERSMSRRPLQTKMATCLVGFSLGDLVAQSVTWAREPVLPDVPRRKYRHAIHGSRIARMGLFGAFVAAPQMHAFFTWLDRVVMPTTPKHPLCVLCKVCLDQLVNSPIGTATFFMWTQAWKGRPERVVPELREKLVPTTMVAWRLWPAAQAINFLMVPSHLRILFLNAVAIIWTTILSTISN